MALVLPQLPRQCHGPYRPDVPRLPKNFQIDWVSVELLEPLGYLSTGPDTAVPSRFEANFQLGKPEMAVTIEVFVGPDLRPAVVGMTMRSKVRTPITTSVLRSVLIDQLLQKALEEATVPASVREEWLDTLPFRGRPHEQQTDTARPPTEPRSRSHADDDARTAAQIYSEAVRAGSRSPAVAVANTMDRSRAQVARYIRRAREMKLLPPLEPNEKT